MNRVDFRPLSPETFPAKDDPNSSFPGVFFFFVHGMSSLLFLPSGGGDRGLGLLMNQLLFLASPTAFSDPLPLSSTPFFLPDLPVVFFPVSGRPVGFFFFFELWTTGFALTWTGNPALCGWTCSGMATVDVSAVSLSFSPPFPVTTLFSFPPFF